MAFCKYCGNQLGEGETCTCEKAVAAQTTVEQKVETVSTNQLQEGKQNSELISKSKSIAKDIFSKLVAIWKKPADEGNTLICSQNYKEAIIFVVIQAVLSGFMGLAQIKKMSGALKMITSSVSGFMGTSAVKLKLPYGKAFFYMVLAVIAIAALFYIAYFILLKIMKIQVNAKQLLCFVSLGSVASIPFTVVAIVFTFINQTVGVIIFMASAFMAIAYTMQAAKSLTRDQENKSVYFVALGLEIVSCVVLIFVYSKFSSLLESAVSSFSNIANLF